MTTERYALGSEERELIRLRTQADLLAEPTENLLRRGGLEPGMRVLDLGSGPGDVSFQVSAIVGPRGSVVAVEHDPAQLANAELNRTHRGIDNVTFRQADARTFIDETPFDAVVCRLLLMHLSQPGEVIAHHLKNLGPGGIFVAVDYDIAAMRSLPEVELFSSMNRWATAGFAEAGVDPFVGMRLPQLIQDAGYENVGCLGFQRYFAPGNGAAVSHLVDVLIPLEPAILVSGVVSAEELDVKTLSKRVASALNSANAAWTTPTVVGGWGRKPA
jgi:ubiquinone/menaquinone biosynthesis C-methylase UbiE